MFYCSYEGRPTIYTLDIAWLFVDGRWVEINSSEVAMSAAVIGEEAFKARFGQLPPLPK